MIWVNRQTNSISDPGWFRILCLDCNDGLTMLVVKTLSWMNFPISKYKNNNFYKPCLGSITSGYPVHSLALASSSLPPRLAYTQAAQLQVAQAQLAAAAAAGAGAPSTTRWTLTLEIRLGENLVHPDIQSFHHLIDNLILKRITVDITRKYKRWGADTFYNLCVWTNQSTDKTDLVPHWSRYQFLERYPILSFGPSKIFWNDFSLIYQEMTEFYGVPYFHPSLWRW